MTDNNEITELERSNKTCMAAHIATDTVMLLLLVLQAVTRGINPLVLAISFVLGIVPVTAEIIFWRRSHDTAAIKHLVGNGFAVFFTFYIYTSTTFMASLFVIPMILVISVYNDKKYSLMVNSGVVIETIILAAIGLNKGMYSYPDSDAAAIHIIFVTLTAIYSYITSSTLSSNEKKRLNDIKASQKKTEQLLNDISELSEKMTAGIEYIKNWTCSTRAQPQRLQPCRMSPPVLLIQPTPFSSSSCRPKPYSSRSARSAAYPALFRTVCSTQWL